VRFLDVAGPELRDQREAATTWIAEHGGGR